MTFIKKKKIVIIHDSMIKQINDSELLRLNSLKIRCQSSSATGDIINHIKNTARKTPDMIIIHASTNGIPIT